MARPRKQTPERIIEALTWASVLIWIGFAFIAHILNYVWLVVLVLSVILLSSAIYQRSRNWETSLSIWVFGIWMAVFSVLETVNEMIKLMNNGDGLDIDIAVYLGVALVSMGVAAVFTMINPSDVVGLDKRRPTDYDRERDYAPRRVSQESVSSAYLPPAQGSAQFSTNTPPEYNRGYSQNADSRAREYARRIDDPFDRIPDYDVDRGDYAAYSDPLTPTSTAYPDAGYYEEAPPRDQRRARPVDSSGRGAPSYAYPTQERPYAGERLSRQRSRGHSQPQRSQRTAPRVVQPTPQPRQPQSSDLQARVEDIIQRSRSQRTGTVPPSSDDLPY
ncbi:MAG: hypothetical protein JXA10_12545 [Anaerolineae bacterium]|nr:hypothetical protein [Anaerolineae bacterium]